VKLGLDLVRD